MYIVKNWYNKTSWGMPTKLNDFQNQDNKFLYAPFNN